MRLQLTVTHRRPSCPGTQALSVVDLEVDAPTGSTAAELMEALAQHLGLPGTSPHPRGRPSGDQVPGEESLTLVVGGVVVAPGAIVGLPPLLDGAALALHPRTLFKDSSTRSSARCRSAVVLAVTHGPDCGRVIDLRPGRHTVGRSGEADICIDDPRLSRRHTEVCVDAHGVTLRDLGSTNGTRVDEAPVGDEPVTVTTASVIHLGDTMVALRHTGAVPAATTTTGEGTLAVNRRPRVLDRHAPASIALPAPPQQPRPTRVPWLAVLLPVPVAAVLAVVVGPTMLAFALMGPVLMVGTALSDRWGARRTYAADLVAHDAELRTARDCIEAACRHETRELTRSFPGPATVLGIVSGPTEQLWERRRDDDDALVVTIGRCRQDASLRLLRQATAGVPEQQPQLHDAPCTLSLGEVGVLGLCGEPSAVAASARSLVGQLLTLHSPADLGVVCLLRAEELRNEWVWLGRVPHCHHAFRRRAGPVPAVLGPDTTTVHATVAALATTIRERLANHRSTPWSGSTTLVVIDGARAFRAVPGLATVLADGPRVGVVCLTLGAERRELPHEAGAVLDLPPHGPPALSLPGHRHDRLVADGVALAWSERLSRSLAPLRDATPSEGPAALPVAVGLLGCRSPLDGAPTDPVTELLTGRSLAEAWRHRPHSTTVPLGVCGTGTFSIDLASDGPHVLVGGTTGAGKSELLRTLVASLALHNTPQHLSFVLVDYKGGAAFRECAKLPHVAGVVTDLDDHLAARALTSLTAELTRREWLLRDAGAADFVSYQASPAGEGTPLARLVVVVDEFRALAEELPAFVDGLVHVAALGRSLGIHLVLATQRPAGVVTADIKANVNLRIALRMRDRTDSEDVVDSPAAASLDPSAPGRAYARVGGSPLLEFQSAHVGSRVVEPSTESVRVRRWTFCPSTPWPVGTTAVEQHTELTAIVAAVQQATTVARLEPAPAAWLPPLPAHVPHCSLDEPPDAFTVHLGLVDVPEQQRRESLALDLRDRGHWAVVGSPGSGRTTALLTVARSLCGRRGPESLHVYAVSGGGLAALGSLPHVGAHIDWTDTNRVERLVTRLSAEVAGRRAALTRRGVTTLVEWWRSTDCGSAPPPILLLVDDWDLVAGRHDDLTLASLVDRLLVLLREGEAVGLTAVLAGDRTLGFGRAGGAVSNRVVLHLTDPADAVLLGLAPYQLAALKAPGRGLTSQGHQVQLALPPDLPPLPSLGPGSTCAVVPAPFNGRRAPLHVDALPPVVREDELVLGSGRTDSVALGIGGDDSTVLGLDPGRDGRRWLVTGAAGSGVSTTLLLIVRGLAAAGRPVAVVGHRGGPLDALRGDPAVAAWCDGANTASLVEARQREPSLAVVVDAADELIDHPVETVLREVAHLVDRDGGLLVVGANATALSSMYRGIAYEVARHRTGVLLGPTSTAEGGVLGVRAPVDRAARPGRGHVVQRGSCTPLQVALPDSPPIPVAAPRAAG